MTHRLLPYLQCYRSCQHAEVGLAQPWSLVPRIQTAGTTVKDMIMVDQSLIWRPYMT